MNMYDCGELNIYHYDLYRISSVSELTEIGFYDFAGTENSVTLVEWAEKLDGELPEKRIDVTIEDAGESRRKITVKRV
jgi:tRNA threonylcarbamoyladenosine biosynthesis protein TsaE